jgi:hypothetical protein
MRSKFARAALLVAVMVLAAACTKSLDSSHLESELKSQLETKLSAKDVKISCPDSEPVESGTVFTCQATDATGASATVTVTETDDKGNVTWKITAVQQPSATPSP